MGDFRWACERSTGGPPAVHRRGLVAGPQRGSADGRRARGAPGTCRSSIHSRTRPWRGTFGDVLDLARRAASGLVARGVRPGDVVTFQTPNWLEGAVTFYAAVFAGAVVAPIVHIYGTRETSYILDACRPQVHVTASQFGHQDFLANLEDDAGHPGNAVGRPRRRRPGRQHRVRRAPGGATPHRLAGAASTPAPRPSWGGRRARRRARRASSTRTRRCAPRSRSSERHRRPRERPSLIANPISHAIGMLGALLIPVDRGQAGPSRSTSGTPARCWT